MMGSIIARSSKRINRYTPGSNAGRRFNDFPCRAQAED
jgi:hypothetical protein